MMCFQGVYKAFSGKTVLKDVSFSVSEGEKLALKGASGSGKTTVLNLAMGLLQPDAGSIMRQSGIRMAAVFQEDRLIEHMHAIDNIALATGRTDKQSIAAALRQVGMEECLKPVRKLSGGQKRRVAIVRAVLAQPELLLLDEPFKGLDDETRKKTAEFLLQNCAEAAVILVSHDMEDVQLLNIERVISLSGMGSVCEG